MHPMLLHRVMSGGQGYVSLRHPCICAVVYISILAGTTPVVGLFAIFAQVHKGMCIPPVGGVVGPPWRMHHEVWIRPDVFRERAVRAVLGGEDSSSVTDSRIVERTTKALLWAAVYGQPCLGTRIGLDCDSFRVF